MLMGPHGNRNPPIGRTLEVRQPTRTNFGIAATPSALAGTGDALAAEKAGRFHARP